MTPITPILRRMTGLRQRAQRGVAAIEAALILPILAFMLIGAIEVYAYLRSATVLSRTGYTLADILAEAPSLQAPGSCSQAESLCTLWPLAQALARPVNLTQQGAVRVSLYAADPEPNGVSTPPGSPSNWLTTPFLEADGQAAGVTLPPLLETTAGPPATVGDVLIVVQTSLTYQPALVTNTLWHSLAGNPRLERVAYALGRGSLLPEEP